MVSYVEKYSSRYKEVPHKFEAGTLKVEGILSLSKAIDLLIMINLKKSKKNY